MIGQIYQEYLFCAESLEWLERNQKPKSEKLKNINRTPHVQDLCVESLHSLRRMQKERKFSRVLMGSTRSCGQKKQPKPENKEKQADPESSEESNQGADTEKETVKVVVQDGNPSKESNEGPPTGKPGVQFQEPKPDVKQIVISPSGNPSPVAEKKVSIAVQVGNENEAPPAAPGNEKSGASSSAGGLEFELLNGEDVLISFGGYNGRYNNDVLYLNLAINQPCNCKQLKVMFRIVLLLCTMLPVMWSLKLKLVMMGKFGKSSWTMIQGLHKNYKKWRLVTLNFTKSSNRYAVSSLSSSQGVSCGFYN
ncbi:hypothetical protein K1719_033189 [Acacia pycnantha]|nr:hypothetical protein K1719_033189 [Acacia pycnantha]